MEETNKNIDNTDLSIEVADNITVKSSVVLDSGSASETYENANIKIEYKKELIQVKEKQKILEEKLEFLNKKQNATDSYFIDELESLYQELVASKVNLPKSKIDEFQILLQENIRILTEIGELEDNWNQYGASKFEPELILKCIRFISEVDLDYQPEIFPSVRQSVQIEFEPDENHYLEFEIFIDRVKLYKRIETTKTFMENISESDAIAEIKKFRQEFTYSRFGIPV
ncbi:MAG: hypothetical protein IIA49_13055 [Bacteroidetes bacterium]|nr:hypothetical protein [Bacteroidota bacterium]